jgi:hypothetical protein
LHGRKPSRSGGERKRKKPYRADTRNRLDAAGILGSNAASRRDEKSVLARRWDNPSDDFPPNLRSNKP